MKHDKLTYKKFLVPTIGFLESFTAAKNTETLSLKNFFNCNKFESEPKWGKQ